MGNRYENPDEETKKEFVCSWLRIDAPAKERRCTLPDEIIGGGQKPLKRRGKEMRIRLLPSHRYVNRRI